MERKGITPIHKREISRGRKLKDALIATSDVISEVATGRFGTVVNRYGMAFEKIRNRNKANSSLDPVEQERAKKRAEQLRHFSTRPTRELERIVRLREVAARMQKISKLKAELAMLEARAKNNL